MCCAKLPQSCLALSDPVDCSPPGSSGCGILQARVLEWVAMPSSSSGSSQPRDQTQVSYLLPPAKAGGFFSTTSEVAQSCLTLQPHGLQHARPPCPSPSPGARSNTPDHLSLCHPLLLLSVFPSVRVFSKHSTLCIRWPKCRGFSFSVSSSEEYSGYISFRIDWFDFHAAQGTPMYSVQNAVS